MIREYIRSQLIEPFKIYPTTIQDTLMTIITDRLEELYEYTRTFPEIISPNSSRLDILQAILKQFDFTIREEADIEEQVAILENVLHLYRNRGSVETIENLWRYYGGDLPREIKINIPSYNLFRYSMSAFSSTHVFPDGEHYRTGVYEVVVYNSNYSIPKLKDFLLEELVAAGNRIYFTNSVYSFLIDENVAFNYDIHRNDFKNSYMRIVSYKSSKNLWSGSLPLSSIESILSGNINLFFELTQLVALPIVDLLKYDIEEIISTAIHENNIVTYFITADTEYKKILRKTTSYTEPTQLVDLKQDFYNAEGELIENRYSGYFILNTTLLGSEVS